MKTDAFFSIYIIIILSKISDDAKFRCVNKLFQEDFLLFPGGKGGRSVVIWVVEIETLVAEQ